MTKPNPSNEKLIRAADSLFMRLGLRSVSMDDVAREAGISKKTLYQLVENKHELVKLVLEADICNDREVLDQHRDVAADAIDEFLRNSRYFIREMRRVSPTTMYDLRKYYPDLWENQSQAHMQDFGARVAENLRRGQEEGLYRNDVEPDVVAKFYVSAATSLMNTEVFPATDRPLFGLIYQLSLYHFNGVVNSFGRDRLDEYLKVESLD